MANSDEQIPKQDEISGEFDEDDFDYEFDDDFEEETDEEIAEIQAAHEGDFTSPPAARVDGERDGDWD